MICEYREFNATGKPISKEIIGTTKSHSNIKPTERAMYLLRIPIHATNPLYEARPHLECLDVELSEVYT